MKIRFAVSPGALAEAPAGGALAEAPSAGAGSAPSERGRARGGRFDPERFAAVVDGLEERRFDTIWLSDLPLGGSVEPVVGLSFAAARTRRLKLGANLVPIGRSSLQLAKQLAQLDQLSGGRLLLTAVPGLGSPDERAALGLAGRDRGAALELAVTELRDFWARGPARPVQEPLELWFGGFGPRALERAGRLADGWLGAAMTPDEVAIARQRIDGAAEAAGRRLDPEHFGMSIPYARIEAAPAAYASLAARRGKADPASLLPVGRDALCRLVEAYVAAGCSKFVLRPVEAGLGTGGDRDGAELDWLASTVLPLQT